MKQLIPPLPNEDQSQSESPQIIVKQSTPQKPNVIKQPSPKRTMVVKKSSPQQRVVAKNSTPNQPTKKSPPQKSIVAEHSATKKLIPAQQPQQSRTTVIKKTNRQNLVADRKAAKHTKSFANQNGKPIVVDKKSPIASFERDKDILYEEEELAYQDAYKRSLYKDPFEREYILEDTEAYHADLAGALTKPDIDRAVRDNELEKLQQWLQILTETKYQQEQNKLTESYLSTKAYIRAAINRLLN